MRMLKWIVCVCFVLVVSVGLTRAAEEKEKVPVIEIKERTYDFKEVKQGEVVTHDFQVFNRGNANLEIKEVRPG